MTVFRSFASFLVLVVLAAAATPLRAQETPPAVSSVVAAFAQGNARALTDASADRLDVSLPGGASVYSRAQARLIFARFFDETSPRGFRVEHQMGSGAAYFVTGRYTSRDGAFTVLLRFGARGNTWELREVHVERHGLE